MWGAVFGVIILLIILVVGYLAIKGGAVVTCHLPIVGGTICPKDAPGGEGGACNQPDGTIWPFSGCDASAGMCCNKKCSVGPCSAPSPAPCSAPSPAPAPAPHMAGAPCNRPNGTIWPFSGCDVSAGLCCGGKCSAGPC